MNPTDTVVLDTNYIAEAPELQAVSDRVSTPQGCREFEDALTAELAKMPGGSRQASLVKGKLCELARIQMAHTIAGDRDLVAAVLGRDQAAVAGELSEAQNRLAHATRAVGVAQSAHADRAALLGGLQIELSNLHASADDAVTAAQEEFASVFSSGTAGRVAELEAADKLRKAQAHRVACGDVLIGRINGLANEREAASLWSRVLASISRAAV